MPAADRRRYWGLVTPLPAPALAAQAKMLEEVGLEGVFAPQVYGPPFVPLAVAPLLGEAIRRIHTGQSVGALFNGR